jgi:hypothetical protein
MSVNRAAYECQKIGIAAAVTVEYCTKQANSCRMASYRLNKFFNLN